MYDGGKNGAGVYQTIINQMPPHEAYIEAFMGSGAILRKKKPAQKSIAIEADAAAIARFGDAVPPSTTVIHGDAISLLSEYPYTGRELVYCDPPYLMSTRKGGKLYRCELADADHIRLLAVLKALPCMVMVSGYFSRLYADQLAAWRYITFQAQTRHGTATEWLWMNYPEPKALHDYSYLGAGYRERERIKRKALRWADGLARLPELERKAIMSQLASS